MAELASTTVYGDLVVSGKTTISLPTEAFHAATKSYVDDNFSLDTHVHGAGDITSGTFADVRIAQSNVTQHQGALSITESQISDLVHYTTANANAAIDARVTNAFVDALNVDADTVDGQHASAFATSGHGHNHDSLTGFVANEHIDWTADQGATNIHVNNITGYSPTGHGHTESDISNLDHLTIEEVQDNLGNSFLVAGTDISITYDDAGNTLTIESTATGVTDHGALTGRGDDDHTHYSLASGARAFTGTVAGVDPTADSHLATKAYIDTIVGADTLLLMGA